MHKYPKVIHSGTISYNTLPVRNSNNNQISSPSLLNQWIWLCNSTSNSGKLFSSSSHMCSSPILITHRKSPKLSKALPDKAKSNWTSLQCTVVAQIKSWIGEPLKRSVSKTLTIQMTTTCNSRAYQASTLSLALFMTTSHPGSRQISLQGITQLHPVGLTRLILVLLITNVTRSGARYHVISSLIANAMVLTRWPSNVQIWM